MKGHYTYKVRELIEFKTARKKWLVYKTSRTPQEICFTYSRTRAYEVAKALNEFNNQRFKLEG